VQKGKATILRYNPEIDGQPHYGTYEFPFEPGMSVLDLPFIYMKKLTEHLVLVTAAAIATVDSVEQKSMGNPASCAGKLPGKK